MKKNAIRILSLFLVVMTLVGVISLPVSAYSYPMNYTITYKTKDGKTLGTNSGQADAEATVREALRVTSPSYDGYVLSDSNDSVVTGKMISWRFPASNYHGSEKKTAPHHQTNSVRVTAVTGLLKNLANTFRDKILGDDAKKLPTIDKRQRREIEEKRNAGKIFAKKGRLFPQSAVVLL